MTETQPVAACETHVSSLFFVGDRVYKLKKPVTLDFVDLSTAEARRRNCDREVELNRRLAPDVYLGVATVLDGDGVPCDSLVVMRRMPEARRLSTLVASGADVRSDVRAIARVIAAFHARAGRSPVIGAAGRVGAVRARWEANFATMRPFAGTVLEPEVFERVTARARRYLDGREELFRHRIDSGQVCDGHGDLLADDVFCLDDGPRILDCLEFDDDLRYGDVVADIAFLAMDLERLGAPDAAADLLDAYAEFSAATYPSTLLHHYIAYRAHVRAKVACLRVAQGDERAGDVASRHLNLADDHLRTGRVVLALVGGLPGTGKSTLSTALSDRLGWSVIRSDEVRKDLAGLGHTVHRDDAFGTGLYGADATAATYAEVIERARSLLAMGEPVILDASWHSAEWRDAARLMAEAAAADFVEVRCDAPPEVTRVRMEGRAEAGTDASDATVAVAQRMRMVSDAWSTARTVDTTGSVESTVAEVLGWL